MTRSSLAIVGIACRFPGEADSPDAFWKMLSQGGDGLSDVPEGRWDERHLAANGLVGKVVRRGGFLSNVDRFDAAFFGISPKEAKRLDPQQRLLLELGWEVIEDAGLDPNSLAGTSTGVFVGVSGQDYGVLQDRELALEVDAYTISGSVGSLISNRLSYAMDLRGPSMSVDTACSSSLVAATLACQSIWERRSTAALIGGVNLMLRPETTVGFNVASMLAADARCKSFDADADGYVRAEGAGMIYVKSLDDAIKDGNRIYAVIRSAVTNQDGQTTGLTVPSEEAQVALLEAALSDAGIAGCDVDYIEAHGTGTPVGDRIELRALNRVFGKSRVSNSPCLIGSVKTNIGHLETASGIAGLIKTILAIHHGHIPPSINYARPNEELVKPSCRLRVVEDLTNWPKREEGTRTAGVNSFGFGGANAHLLLGSGPPRSSQSEVTIESRDGRPGGFRMLPISGRADQAVSDYALSLANELISGGLKRMSLDDIVASNCIGRAHHTCRAAIIFDTRQDLIGNLIKVAHGENDVGITRGRIKSSKSQRQAFVFSGMGPQWAGMGRDICDQSEVFRDELRNICDLFESVAGWSLWDELQASEEQSQLAMTSVGQPAIFALQMALAALWRSWGVEPAAVVGHSVGEVAAATVAGCFDLKDAVKLVFHRSRCQQLTSGSGGMLVVALTPDEMQSLLTKGRYRAEIAAINSPKTVSIAGETQELESIVANLRSRSVFHRFLATDVPFHCRLMDPIRDELLASLSDIKPRSGNIPLISTVTGGFIEGEELGPEYWWNNVRQPVRFLEAIDQLLGDSSWPPVNDNSDAVLDESALEVNQLVEISPHPVLTRSIDECVDASNCQVTALPSLRRDRPGLATLLESLGRLYVEGSEIDWLSHIADGVTNVRLPSYPWQRERYWFKDAMLPAEQQSSGLLGDRMSSIEPSSSWITYLDVYGHPWINDHLIGSSIIFPGVGYIELALEAAAKVFRSERFDLKDVRFLQPLIVDEAKSPEVQTIVDSHGLTFAIHTRIGRETGTWTQNATGQIQPIDKEGPRCVFKWNSARNRCRTHYNGDEFYDALNALGFRYGPAFQGVDEVWCGDSEAVARVSLKSSEKISRNQAQREAILLAHPALVDSALQCIFGAFALGEQCANDSFTKSLLLPVRIGSYRYLRKPPSRLWAHAVVTERGSDYFVGDIKLIDDDGNVCIEVLSFKARTTRSIERTSKSDGMLYAPQWVSQPLPHCDSRHQPGVKANNDELEQTLRRTAQKLDRQYNFERLYKDVWPTMERLASVATVRALDSLGWSPHTNELFTTEQLATKLGIPTNDFQFRLLGRLLRMLVNESLAEQVGDHWKIKTDYQRIDRDMIPLWNRFWKKSSGFLAEASLLRRGADSLASVLTGSAEGLEVIFPGGGFSLAEHLYADSLTYRVHNMMLRQTVQDLLTTNSSSLRILEVGGGTAGLTAYLFPVLKSATVSYTFTDLGAHFVSRARERFAGQDWMEFRELDLTRNPSEQGFSHRRFDMIIASDVIHATPNIRATLRRLTSLLDRNGAMLILEGTRLNNLALLSFGLIRDWWYFEDEEVRGIDPWAPQSVWHRELSSLPFADVRVVGDSSEASRSVHSIVVATGLSSERPASGQTDGSIASHVDVKKSLRDKPCVRIVFTDDLDVWDLLAQDAHAAGHGAVHVRTGNEFERNGEDSYSLPVDSIEAFQMLLASISVNCSVAVEVVHAWSLPERCESHILNDGIANRDRVIRIAHSYVNIVRALVQAGDAIEVIRLCVVTEQAQCRTLMVEGGSELNQSKECRPDGIDPIQSLVWGLARTTLVEHPALDCRLIDLSNRTDSREQKALLEELHGSSDEVEVMIRGSHRYVIRLQRGLSKQTQKVNVSETPIRLETDGPGLLDRLHFAPFRPSKPRHGEVQIEVAATGLNFKDVAIALGLLPEETFNEGYVGQRLGIECAGHVVAVGEGVNQWSVGDPVITCAPNCFATHVTTKAELLIRKPDNLSFDEAATIPVAFATAHYALVTIGRLKKGDLVLIHAAAGGVGQAAVQIAKMLGLRVFATAGSQDKRDFLLSLGVEMVGDSRTLDFGDEVMKWSENNGVSLVLNSLAGSSLAVSLSVVSRYGHFVEIGKNDIHAGAKLSLTPFQRNLHFSSVDLDQMMAERPDIIASELRIVVDLLSQNELHPLPHRTFPISRVREAFEHVARAQHKGKVVVSIDRGVLLDVECEPKDHASRNQMSRSIQSNATYLIVGGLGGFGFELAKWLISQGAQNLILLSKSGQVSSEIKDEIERQQVVGRRIVTVKADITNFAQLDEALVVHAKSLPPIRGVFHSAMRVDDKPLTAMDGDTLDKVLQPKTIGVWNLHRATEHLDLDLFVLFSSFTSLLGSPAQSNYVAANTFLDSFAVWRRLRGQPALSINWGVVQDVGWVARNPQVLDSLAEINGFAAVTSEEYLAVLRKLIAINPVQIGVADIDWSRVRQKLPGVTKIRRFDDVMESTQLSESERDQHEILTLVSKAAPDELMDILVGFIVSEVASVMGISADRIDTTAPLINQGVDSLMALELQHRLETATKATIPPMLFVEGGTVQSLAIMIRDSLASVVNVTRSGTSWDSLDSEAALRMAHEIDSMSDSEVERLLAEAENADR